MNTLLQDTMYDARFELDTEIFEIDNVSTTLMKLTIKHTDLNGFDDYESFSAVLADLTQHAQHIGLE